MKRKASIALEEGEDDSSTIKPGWSEPRVWFTYKTPFFGYDPLAIKRLKSSETIVTRGAFTKQLNDGFILDALPQNVVFKADLPDKTFMRWLLRDCQSSVDSLVNEKDTCTIQFSTLKKTLEFKRPKQVLLSCLMRAGIEGLHYRIDLRSLLPHELFPVFISIFGPNVIPEHSYPWKFRSNATGRWNRRPFLSIRETSSTIQTAMKEGVLEHQRRFSVWKTGMFLQCPYEPISLFLNRPYTEEDKETALACYFYSMTSRLSPHLSPHLLPGLFEYFVEAVMGECDPLETHAALIHASFIHPILDGVRNYMSQLRSHALAIKEMLSRDELKTLSSEAETRAGLNCLSFEDSMKLAAWYRSSHAPETKDRRRFLGIGSTLETLYSKLIHSLQFSEAQRLSRFAKTIAKKETTVLGFPRINLCLLRSVIDSSLTELRYNCAYFSCQCDGSVWIILPTFLLKAINLNVEVIQRVSYSIDGVKISIVPAITSARFHANPLMQEMGRFAERHMGYYSLCDSASKSHPKETKGQVCAPLTLVLPKKKISVKGVHVLDIGKAWTFIETESKQAEHDRFCIDDTCFHDLPSTGITNGDGEHALQIIDKQVLTDVNSLILSFSEYSLCSYLFSPLRQSAFEFEPRCLDWSRLRRESSNTATRSSTSYEDSFADAPYIESEFDADD